LLHQSFIRIFYQDDALLKVVTMTKPILELEIEKYICAVEAKTTENDLMKKELEQMNDELAQTNETITTTAISRIESVKFIHLFYDYRKSRTHSA